MAVKRPSFLKKLKEQQRRARADEKREARRARKLAKASRGDETAAPELGDPLEQVSEASSEDADPGSQ